MGKKTNIWSTISIVLIFLMIIAVPSFAFFDEFGSGAEDFFDGAGEGADDFFDGIGGGADDFFDGMGDGSDDFFDGIGGSSGDYFDGVGALNDDSDAEFGGIDDLDDGFDGLPTGMPDDDDGIEFPPTQPGPDDPIEFPPKNAKMALEISESSDPAAPGSILTYTIGYVNGGYVDANDVSLAVMYDDKTGYRDASPQPTGGTDKWRIGKVLPQKDGVIKINVLVSASAKDGDVITFKANIKYIDSTTGKQDEASAIAQTKVKVSGTTPPGPEPSPPSKLDEGVSLKIVSTRFPFTGNAGSALPIYITVENNGNEKLEDTTITVLSQELAIRTSIGPFDLGKGDTESRTLLLRIPANAPAGKYPLRFTISSNSQIKRIVYRELEIR